MKTIKTKYSFDQAKLTIEKYGNFILDTEYSNKFTKGKVKIYFKDNKYMIGKIIVNDGFFIFEKN